MITGIYKITNKLNGKVYIGQSVNIEERFKSHKYSYNNSKASGYNTKFYRALWKYGIANFSFEIVEECSRDQLNIREDYWQDFFKAKEFGYSIK